MAKMAVNLGGIAMKNPVTVASGTFGYGQEYAQLFDISRLGAVTVKGIRACPWPGNPLPRHTEVPGGMINAIGLQGPGVEAFIRDDMPFLVEKGVPAIINIWGTSADEYAEVAARLEGVPGVAGLELNVSCPNVKEGGASFGTKVETFVEVVKRVRAATTLPIMPKLAPNVPDVRPFVQAAQDAGANAIALINTMPSMAVDLETRRPILANKVGGLSGAGIHPIALKHVYEAAQVATVPLLAMGGIFSAKDALDFILVGATAVAVGTATFIDPLAPIHVLEGMEQWLDAHGIADVNDFRGTLQV
ncbi:MAG: dihydroorotate dehydrogenase [Kiritimatiellae bacterium]|nr:dihydroorotate dehydrogenase [Kiritimatiellia bacterium]MBR4945419.1 dihydroorotate dehydrogenase [Kiritimatiellia bacterium]MBR5588207.1 dihydroorotate dehydrogenase [Kiritimatiellia bacterium]